MQTPRFVIDEAKLESNAQILDSVRRRTGVKILLAQKAYSLAATYPLLARHLDGTTASSLFEAKHGHDFFGGETHVYAAAYAPGEIDEILSLVDHIVFNSPRQFSLYAAKARARGVSAGLRVNPETPVATTPAYDPCRPGSRLGTVRAQLEGACPAGLEGLHFHCLCEQGLDELKTVLAGFEEKFSDLLPAVKWVNFGGGHHITRPGYDVDGLVGLLSGFRARHPHLGMYLEPGEAVALDAGTLETTVLEVQPPSPDGVSNAIIDASPACHMPDTLEMPYVPPLNGARKGDGGPFAYRIGGATCLAGDVIGPYSFDRPLNAGDVLEFGDMAIYTIVKTNHFNGMRLPSVCIRRMDGTLETIQEYGYEDFARANAASRGA